jgi:hypothetical protein
MYYGEPIVGEIFKQSQRNYEAAFLFAKNQQKKKKEKL